MGVVITDIITPSSHLDTYPTHDSNYGLGGHREVATIVDRNAIAVSRRKAGMTVAVAEDEVTYQLVGGIGNEHWKVFGGGGAGSIVEFSSLSSEERNMLTGPSAYQIAVEEGFVGTKEDWLASLKGEDGVVRYTGAATVSVGGISIGDNWTNTPIEVILEALLSPELNPDLIAPTCTLSSTIYGLVEVGSTISTNLLSTLDRGSITPQYDATSEYRSGVAIKHTFISSTGMKEDIVTSDSAIQYTVPAFTMPAGFMSFSSCVEYAAGVQPKTSKGNDYDEPLESGTTDYATVYLYGVYPCYAGIDTLSKLALIEYGNAITVNVPADINVGGSRLKILYPSVWSGLDPVIQQENELSGGWDTQNMSEYTIGTVDLEGITYKQIEYTGAAIGARKLRLIF